MKKWLLGLLLVLLLPSMALAADVRSGGKHLAVNSGETVSDDLYAAASTVNISGNVAGDAVVAGSTVRFDGNITQDLLAAGAQVTLDGSVGDDVRVAGGTLVINGKINGDLFIGGGDVEIGSTAVIKGLVFIAGGTVTLAGQTGPVKAAANTLEVTKTAVINGDLTYRSNQEAAIDTNAKILGQTHFTQIRTNRAAFASLVGLGTIFGFFWWIASFILAGLFFVIAPRKTEHLVKNWRGEFWTNLLTGFLFMVAAPVAAIVLLFTIIGIPVTAGLLMLIPVMMFFAKLLSILVIGCWVQRSWDKENADRPTWLAALVGAIILTALAIIPFAGWLAILVVTLTSLGALLRFDWNLIKTLRQNHTI